MNWRSLVSVSAATALGLTLLAGNAVAQQKSLKEQLVGTWTFVSAVDTNKDGTKSDRWGPNAKGLAIFDDQWPLFVHDIACRYSEFCGEQS